MSPDEHTEPDEHTGSSRIRLFLAVELPDPVLRELERITSMLQASLGVGRWVPPANRHVTVKFLGWTWPRLLPWVEREVELVARTEQAFHACLTGLGTFPPGSRKARVLWAGIDDPDERLARLASGLDAALAREFEPERRAFSAHATLARFDPPVQVPLESVEPHVEPFAIEAVTLFLSHLKRPAPVYESIASFPLGPVGQRPPSSPQRKHDTR